MNTVAKGLGRIRCNSIVKVLLFVNKYYERKDSCSKIYLGDYQLADLKVQSQWVWP